MILPDMEALLKLNHGHVETGDGILRRGLAFVFTLMEEASV